MEGSKDFVPTALEQSFRNCQVGMKILHGKYGVEEVPNWPASLQDLLVGHAKKMEEATTTSPLNI